MVKLVALGLAASLVSLSGTSKPKPYYLALGDSLTFGIQPAKVQAGLPPSGFRTGYVDGVAARLRQLVPTMSVVNYGCPGESTRTFISGGCPWVARGQRLHDAYKGAQLRAALAFLHAHQGKVSPITLTLWSNDITELSNACNENFACVRARAPRALAQFAARLSSILGRLRTAAPDAVIVVTGVWNNDVARLAETNALYRSLDATMARVAQRSHARYAELLPIFNPEGSAARQRARVCALTFICSDADGHPTDAGYRAIAGAVWKASGF